MALSLHKEPLTSKGIMKWITSTFDFYRNMALEALWAQHTGDADDNEGILQDYFNAMNHLDLPVTTSGDHEDANGAFYQMSAAAIRWVLSDEIGEKRKGTFPFLRLPAELRTCVCDMVFSYPRSGLNPQRGRSSTGRRSTYFVAVTRDVTQKFTFGLWDDNDPELQVSPPSQILALLRVNKQIFTEASACFYRVNIFYCGDSETTLDTLKSLVPPRRQHLRHLTFFYDPRNSTSGNELFELLASLPNLRKLDIQLDERRWFRSRVPRKRRLYFTAPTIPGLDTLTKTSSNLDVEFAGDCPTIIAYWKSKIEARTEETELHSKERMNEDGKRQQLARAAKTRKKRKTSGT